MKVIKYTPETVTIEKDGSVLIYNLDEVRRKAIYDESVMEVLREYVMEVLREYVRFKLEERSK